MWDQQAWMLVGQNKGTRCQIEGSARCVSESLVTVLGIVDGSGLVPVFMRSRSLRSERVTLAMSRTKNQVKLECG